MSRNRGDSFWILLVLILVFLFVVQLGHAIDNTVQTHYSGATK